MKLTTHITFGSLIDPFRVDPVTGCWVWQRARAGKGAASGGGYGCLRLNGPVRLAHRHAYEQVNGKLAPGFHVRHICNNTLCVNPVHLTSGTCEENAQDRVKDGGYATRLRESDVVAIRHRAAAGEPQRRIAADYSLHQADVSNIVNRKYWKHV